MKSAEELKRRFFKDELHPYCIYENHINTILCNEWIVLDAGCGRTAPVLKKYIGKARALIGIDCEEFTETIAGINLINGDIEKMTGIGANSIDLVISRAVLEHVKNPESLLREVNRVLKPDGNFVFLVPNLYDYNSIISLLIPNKMHGMIISKVEGRKEDDVFPAYYKINTKRRICNLANKTGFAVTKFDYLGQYPSNFMFNKYLFLIATCYEKMLEKLETAAFLRGWILAHLVKN